MLNVGASERLTVGARRGWRRLFARGLPFAFACVLSSACAAPPIQETVTTDATRRPMPEVEAQPVVNDTPRLPARDAEIEQLGDRLAEAITHLHKKRSNAALRALAQAEATTHHALRNNSRDARTRDALSLALKEMEVAGRTIQRGALDDARKQLHTLNQRIDGLDTTPSADTSNQ